MKHNSYADGKMQSIGFTTENGKDAAVGVAEPGEYDFVAERTEYVLCVSGKFILGEKSQETAQRLAYGFLFPKGTPVHLRCEVPTAYFCEYE